jgi:prepilin-type N-terminal cleavage/methylation domain-containing protein
MEFYLNNKKGFTLIEILGVIAVFSILFSSFIYIWNSLDIFRKSRDAKRINDLNALDAAIKSILTTNENVFLGEENIIYISLPDNNSNCSSYNLIPIFSPYTYRCQTINNYLKIDGNGWIPVNFSLGKILNLTVLPVDPLNNKDYFYSYQVKGGRYKLTARFESKSNIPKMVNDNGFEPTLYEVGSNLFIPSPQSGLVAYWSFDEATGTIAIDYSGYGNNGTLYNNPQWTTGKVGGALNFDGSDDYVEKTNSAVMKQLPLTLLTWVKPGLRSDGTDFPNNVISNDRPGYYGHGFGINVWSSGSQMKVEYENGFRTIPSISFNSDTWYYAAVVYTSGNIKSYINGDLIDNFSFTQASLDAGDYIWIGKHNNDTNYGTRRFFKGLIDEVRIYNRALSPEEIKAIYEATK